MKIGINASFARKPDSGTGQVTINYLKKLIEIGHPEHSFVLYLEEDLPESLVLPKNFEKKIFLPLYRRDDLIRKIKWERKILPKKVQQDGCDVLFSLYQSATITKQTKHVMLVHDVVWKIFPKYLGNFRKKIYYKLIEKAMRKADKIITISQNSKQDIEKLCGISGEKISVSLNDCDPLFKEDISKKRSNEILQKYNLGEDDEKSYIFYVGGFDVRKNIRNLIEGYALFWKRYHKEMNIPYLALAGNFHSKLVPLVTDIPQTIVHVNKKYGCPEKNIKLLGFVEQRDLPSLYNEAELFCYPSLYEGFGLPVLEAMNCGCPIVTSNVSSIPEIVSGKDALLVDPRQSEDIAKAIHVMLTDQELRNEKIHSAKESAKKFSLDKFVESIIATITK
ncbi:MAG: glycosyltransferase family 1 protein [Patescibacteria group bacterium]|nr:glycosyltransferase family 1 protein [Patescibacteria group bacterium]